MLSVVPQLVIYVVYELVSPAVLINQSHVISGVEMQQGRLEYQTTRNHHRCDQNRRPIQQRESE
jgi:hypothetical protein